ncbi:MAG: carboxypeptidase M32 [Gaiellaceae bacterium]
MADALTQLKERLTRVAELVKVQRLLSWDQQTMMPPAGWQHRGEHLAMLGRISHETLTDAETGRLLDELRGVEGSLDADSDDAALIRLARRDYEKASRVPTDLRAEMTRTAAEARTVWVKARANSDFESFRPVLERTYELRKRYVDCFEGVDEPYDILLDDFEPETTTAEVNAVFDVLKPELIELISELRNEEIDDSFMRGSFPPEAQERLCNEVVTLFGFRPDTWRLDPTEHPFASGAGVDDIRITTHYDPETMKSFFSTMHEYGHGLYSHQAPRHLESLPTGGPASLGIHESQSRMWENLVGRSRPFWHFFYPRAQAAFPDQLATVDVDDFISGINRVNPSLIRIKADEVTYGMHVILRFELEQDLINGRIAVADLPTAWNDKMQEYLGVDVPNDAQGVLQDTHWASGHIGYFSTYLLGTVMSVQIWEKILEDVPDLEEQIGRGEFGALRDWLGEHVHSLGRKFPPQETLRRATGSTIDPKPYLAYLRAKYGAGVAA